MDDYERRYEAAIIEMTRSLGCARSAVEPYCLRLRRRLGFCPRPLYYRQKYLLFVMYFLFYGVSFAIITTSRNLFEENDILLEDVLFDFSFFGFWMASIMTYWTLRDKKRHGLSDWDDL